MGIQVVVLVETVFNEALIEIKLNLAKETMGDERIKVHCSVINPKNDVEIEHFFGSVVQLTSFCSSACPFN